MRAFDVGHWRPALVNGIHEVCPQRTDVVTVAFGLLKLAVAVGDLALAIGGIKGPAILPANVQRAFVAIEIGAT